jgi:hypothetical protein
MRRKPRQMRKQRRRLKWRQRKMRRRKRNDPQLVLRAEQRVPLLQWRKKKKNKMKTRRTKEKNLLREPLVVEKMLKRLYQRRQRRWRRRVQGGPLLVVVSPSLIYKVELTIPVAPAEEEEKPEIKDEPKGKTIKRPRASSPREFKATKTMLNNLLDQISSHNHGSMFANPVKPVRCLYSAEVSVDKWNDAPGYEDIIKRPMSIKTVRSRIREGQITTIDEFERDVMLIFAYVTSPFFLHVCSADE